MPLLDFECPMCGDVATKNVSGGDEVYCGTCDHDYDGSSVGPPILMNAKRRKYNEPCTRYSANCGADAWLQFDETDPPEYQSLNGKCVVIVENKDDLKVTDEDDPLNPKRLLAVHPSKLRYDKR